MKRATKSSGSWCSRRKSAISKLTKGWQTWIKRGGKYKPLGGIRTKFKAGRLGEEIVRKTLAASFKITPTEKLIMGTGEEYAPEARIFREYKIQKGRRIPLVLEWIQRKGGRIEGGLGRLATRGEKLEILKAKRQKGGKKLRWI